MNRYSGAGSHGLGFRGGTCTYVPSTMKSSGSLQKTMQDVQWNVYMMTSRACEVNHPCVLKSSMFIIPLLYDGPPVLTMKPHTAKAC